MAKRELWLARDKGMAIPEEVNIFRTEPELEDDNVFRGDWIGSYQRPLTKILGLPWLRKGQCIKVTTGKQGIRKAVEK